MSEGCSATLMHCSVQGPVSVSLLPLLTIEKPPGSTAAASNGAPPLAWPWKAVWVPLLSSCPPLRCVAPVLQTALAQAPEYEVNSTGAKVTLENAQAWWRWGGVVHTCFNVFKSETEEHIRTG